MHVCQIITITDREDRDKLYISRSFFILESEEIEEIDKIRTITVIILHNKVSLTKLDRKHAQREIRLRARVCLACRQSEALLARR